MKSTEITERVEHYCHCPYCEALLSDNDYDISYNPGTDWIYTCPKCGREFWAR